MVVLVKGRGLGCHVKRARDYPSMNKTQRNIVFYINLNKTIQ